MSTRKKKPDLGLFIGPQPIKRLGAKAVTLGGGRGKKRSPGSVESVGRIVRRAPEVMVRITGGTQGLKHIGAHLAYIHRKGKLEGEMADGSMVIGKEGVSELAREWFARREGGVGDRQRRSKDTVNCVFSMPSGTPRLAVTEATRLAAGRIFGEEFDYVMVTHTDTDNPHVHLTVLSRGKSGKRLNPGPEDLQSWRDKFAEALRERGVEAESTPRDLRGVVELRPRNALFHIERRGATSDWRANELREAVAIATGQIEAGERPWEVASKNRQARVRAAWLDYADVLESMDDGDSSGALFVKDAGAIREMVARMPEPMTRRERLIAAARTEQGRADATVRQVEERE
ncbi:hypothetical protein J3A72_000415 [Stenotrophomonas sp. PvP093]|uniref:relaxase/mobilization nuclease domain-containing protein n=1 Tax=unclassified Stenotrophomonas TaxID=196198 RepID=UPI001AEB4A54|nr:relaxase/mobilization nuclease domain-containing protein [Stenotrophomonas sp. PvP093]MBP2480123.1 hypothetical protein [Stenotrophomonas sp. PvP093]